MGTNGQIEEAVKTSAKNLVGRWISDNIGIVAGSMIALASMIGQWYILKDKIDSLYNNEEDREARISMLEKDVFMLKDQMSKQVAALPKIELALRDAEQAMHSLKEDIIEKLTRNETELKHAIDTINKLEVKIDKLKGNR